MITQLKFVSIPVSDQDRALAFYTDKLGFEISTDQPMGPGKRWIELRIASSGTRVVLFTMDGQEDRIGTFFNGAFACDNVEATYRQLSQRGVEFVEPPTVQPWVRSPSSRTRTAIPSCYRLPERAADRRAPWK